MAKKNQNTPPQQSNTYTHSQEAVQRPDVGIQPEFTERKGAKIPLRLLSRPRTLLG